MNEQEKEIWLNVFLGKVLQQEIDYSLQNGTPSRIVEEASAVAMWSIEECRKAGITNGPQ